MRLAFVLLSFRVCRACSRGAGLELFAPSLNFKFWISLYCVNNIMHQLDLHEATKPQVLLFFFLPLQDFILGQISPEQFLLQFKTIPLEEKVHCNFLPLCVALDLASCWQRGERPTQRGQSSRRRAPQPKGQLSTAGGGKNNGASARAVCKKDESGSLSISTASRHCSKPQGLRGGGGG